MPCRRSSEFRSMRMGWPDGNATLWTPTATDFASPRGGPDSEGYLSRAVRRAAVTAPPATVAANEYGRSMGREVVLNFDESVPNHGACVLGRQLSMVRPRDTAWAGGGCPKEVAAW